MKTESRADMASQWRPCLGDQLAVAVSLPIAPCEGDSTEQALAAQLLDALAVVEAAPTGRAKDAAMAEDCARIEQKLDVLMHLLSSLLRERVPPARPLTLSSVGLVSPGDWLSPAVTRVVVYPSWVLPLPLILGVEQLVVGEHACGARWSRLEPALEDALARWVFRMHRRALADQRRSRSAHAGEAAKR